MANRVEYAWNVIPIVTQTGSEGPDADVIASDIGTALSGSGTAPNATYANVDIREVNCNGGAAIWDNFPNVSPRVIVIEHMGLVGDGSSETNGNISIRVNSSNGDFISTLEPGEAVFYPRVAVGLYGNSDVRVKAWIID